MRNFFKPTTGIVLLAIAFLATHILFSFQILSFETVSQLLAYFPVGLKLINWSNYYLMKLSFLVLWLSVALLIFLLLWGREAIASLINNVRVRKNYVGQPKENFAHLLKQKPYTFKDHILPKLILSGAYVLSGLIFIYGVPAIENFRFFTLNLLFTDLVLSGQEVDFSSITYLLASFVWTAPIWYFLSILVVRLFEFGNSKEKEEEIVEEHFAVAVE